MSITRNHEQNAVESRFFHRVSLKPRGETAATSPFEEGCHYLNFQVGWLKFGGYEAGDFMSEPSAGSTIVLSVKPCQGIEAAGSGATVCC